MLFSHEPFGTMSDGGAGAAGADFMSTATAIRTDACPCPPSRRPRRRSPRVLLLYVAALLNEFRWSLLGLLAAIVLGSILFEMANIDGGRLSIFMSMYAAWMALLAQQVYSPPPTWYLTLLCGVYPLLGAIIIGEGVIRLALLMVSRRRGEKEWTRVMVSTYREHIIVCGLGHLGIRVIEQLLAAGQSIVCLEQHRNARFVSRAQELKVPVVIRDMKEDQALIDCGIEHARAIVISTRDPIANIEVAMDAKRMNPSIRVVMRAFDEQIAQKISDAMDVEVAFSSSTLAAPMVAAMALGPKAAGENATAPQVKVLSSLMIGGACHVAAELTVGQSSRWVGQRVDQIEQAHAIKLLSRAANGSPAQSPPPADAMIAAGDRLVVHAPADRLAELTA